MEKEKIVEEYKKYTEIEKKEFCKEDSQKVLEIIENNKIDIKILNRCLDILGIKPSKLENLINVFKELNLNEDIYIYNPDILLQTNVTRIRENVDLLKRKKIDLEILKFFPEILAVGKASDMAKVIKYIEESDILKNDPNFILKNGDVIANAKPNEIKKIVKILKEEKIFDEVIKKAPKALYKNDSKRIQEMLDLAKENNVLEKDIILKNPEILAETTKVRINAIINLFIRYGIDPKIINKSPKMLYKNATKEIENIILELRKIGFTNNNIEMMYDFFAIESFKKRDARYNELKFIKNNSKFLKNIMFKNPRVVLDLDMDKALEFQEEIQKGKIKEKYILELPELMLEKNPKDLINILDALEVSNLKGYEEKHPEIFLVKDPGNIIKISDIVNKYKLSKLVLLESEEIFLKLDSIDLENRIKNLLEKGILEENITKDMILSNSIDKKIVEKEKDKNKDKDEDEDKDKKENSESKENLKLTKNQKKLDSKTKEEKVKKETKEEKIDIKKQEEILKISNELLEKLDEIGINKENINEKLNIKYEDLAKEDIEEKILDIFEYFEDIGISKSLQNGYSALNMDLKDIKINMDIFIEQGFFVSIAYNLDKLNVNTDELEKKISILSNNLTIDFEDITLSKKEFLNKNNITEKEFDDEMLLDFAQFNISNKFKKYLNINPRQMYLNESKVYEEIYKKILDLGSVNNNLEYIKCGEKFSILKIEENLHKVLVGIADNENIDIYNLSDFDRLEIMAITILGRRRLEKNISNIIYDSILKNETESIWNKKKEKEVFKKQEEYKKIIIEPVEKEENEIDIVEEEPKMVMSKEDIFDEMQKIYSSNSLKLDKEKILNENELVVPEYEEKLRVKAEEERQIKLKEIEENIKSKLLLLEEKEKEELALRNLAEKSGEDAILNSIKNAVSINESVPSDPDLIILENMDKENSLEENKEKNIINNFRIAKNSPIYQGVSIENESLNSNLNEKININTPPKHILNMDEIKLNKLEVSERIDNPMENKELNIGLERLEKEIMKELEMQNINSSNEISFEQIQNDPSSLNNISFEIENVKEEKLENNKKEEKIKNEDTAILSMLDEERKARAKLEEEIESLKKMQEEFLRSLSDNEKTKESEFKKAPEELEKLKVNLDIPKETFRIDLEEKPNFEKDMLEGAKKDYIEFEKKLNVLSMDPETLIKSNLDRKLQENNEDKIKDEFTKMGSNLDKSLQNFKMFSLESEQRRANFEARKRKKIQEIRDRRARNKTLEEASKLEETARKLREQAKALEEERQRLQKEKEAELERIRLEQIEESKKLEEERIKLEEEKKQEIKRLEEERKLEEEKRKLEEEIRQKELEKIKLDQEKKIASLIKEEAQKIIEEQGLMKVKEEYDKLKKDLTIEKMYNDSKEEKKEKEESKKENLDIKIEENKIENSSEYPENISDFSNTNQNPYNSPSNFDANMFAKDFKKEEKEVSSKDFFDLEDYGYLTQMVDSEEAEKMKASMNLIFKKKREDYTNI